MRAVGALLFNLLLVPFHFSLAFIGKNKTARSLKKTWERGISWTSCECRALRKEKFVENVIEDLTNRNFIGVCTQSLSGEDNGQPLLVISEVTPV